MCKTAYFVSYLAFKLFYLKNSPHFYLLQLLAAPRPHVVRVDFAGPVKFPI